MPECCLDNLSPESFDLQPMGGSEDRAMFKVWNGRIRLAVHNGKTLGKPKMEILISPYVVEAIKLTIKAMEPKAPGEKQSILISEYDRDAKQYKPSSNMTFIKDDKGAWLIQITAMGATQTFAFSSPKNISMGSEPPTERDRSALAIRAFLTWLEIKAPILTVLTKRSDTGGKNFGNRPGGGAPAQGGGYQRPGGQAAGQQAPQQRPHEEANDGTFF